MTDDQTPKGADTPASDEDTSTEEFAHSDRISEDARPTRPATPPTPPPTEPAVLAVDATEDASDTPGEGAEGAESDAEGAAGDESGAEGAAGAEAAPEDGTTSEQAPEPSTEVVEEAAEPRGTRAPLVPILAATTALFFVATVLFGLMAFAPRFAPIKSGPAKLAARAQEEDGLKRIARRFAENFVSLDYKSIDEDLDRMTADATSNFATKLRDTVEQIAPAFKSRKASSSGTALDAQVLSHTDDSAIVRVLIRRTKKNVGTKGPETGNQIVDVTLVKTDDGWKASDLSQLGADDT
jgi:hypothetical protein